MASNWIMLCIFIDQTPSASFTDPHHWTTPIVFVIIVIIIMIFATGTELSHALLILYYIIRQSCFPVMVFHLSVSGWEMREHTAFFVFPLMHEQWSNTIIILVVVQVATIIILVMVQTSLRRVHWYTVGVPVGWLPLLGCVAQIDLLEYKTHRTFPGISSYDMRVTHNMRSKLYVCIIISEHVFRVRTNAHRFPRIRSRTHKQFKDLTGVI